METRMHQMLTLLSHPVDYIAVLVACMLPGTHAGMLPPQIATLVVHSSACKVLNTGSDRASVSADASCAGAVCVHE